MSAMHPESGVPPEDARNSIPNDVEASVNCQELWYSTSRCQPRFDPAAANAMLAELINLINKGEVVYDCTRYDQVQFAVRYLIQRGLTRSCLFEAGPSDFTSCLDPQCTRYNDFMTLTIIPNVDNEGAVTLDLDYLGPRDILRNDGLPLEDRDLKEHKPEIIAYWNGAWYVCGLVASQMPCVLEGNLIRWIRTDGDDLNGDGSENTPQKVFRTIQKAWDHIAQGCVSSSTAVIDLRLGIPGTYAGARLGPFGGTVLLGGDPNNRSGYRITTIEVGNNTWTALALISINSSSLIGVTLVMDAGAPRTGHALDVGNSVVSLNQCALDCAVSNAMASVVHVTGSGMCGGTAGTCEFIGNGNTVGSLVTVGGGTWYGGAQLQRTQYNISNFNFAIAGLWVLDLGVMRWSNNSFISETNCTGPEYLVYNNSVLVLAGEACPGNMPGTIASGGQVTP